VRRRRFAVLLIGLLAACSPTANGPPAAKLDRDKLDAGVDAQIGGLGTCVILADAKTGVEVYRYGHFDVCTRPLPPCSTFDIVNEAIGLDAGVITPQTVFKWDGASQPVKLWERDADLAAASKDGVGWWYQRLARLIGRDRFAQALRAFGYGSKDPAGPADSFWSGPQAGGGLTISTRQQIAFLKGFYGGGAPIKPQTAAAVQALTLDETRADPKGGEAAISGAAASCASLADGSRNVGWWIGRLRTPQRDLVFAASVEGAEAPPGLEIERRLKTVFADAGLWPAG
jgi:beta-lactamase class D